jgi:predicted ATP-dependent protease
VHDADVLEKTGLLGIIRHTWKLTNSEKINHKNVTNKDIQKVLDHIKWRENKLQTNIAKNIARYLNISFTKQKTKTIITVTVKMAFDGIITEKIAFTLHKYLNKEQNKKLKEQLNLSYLNKFK